MTRTNAFGKKINSITPVYLLIILLVIVGFAYLGLRAYTSYRIAQLQVKQSLIEKSINDKLILHQDSFYDHIDTITPYLPDQYLESQIYNELMLVKNETLISLSSNYAIDIYDQQENPFSKVISNNLNYVRIEIEFTVTNHLNIFDYLDELEAQNRIYYIDQSTVSFSTAQTTMSLTLYTFYMN